MRGVLLIPAAAPLWTDGWEGQDAPSLRQQHQARDHQTRALPGQRHTHFAIDTAKAVAGFHHANGKACMSAKGSAQV